MGYKSRAGWQINICLKKGCKNRGVACKDCFGYSKYKIFGFFRKKDKKGE